MNGITSPVWTAFLNEIKEARAELGNPEILWYRGHPNSQYYLLANLLRYKNGLEKEKHLFNSFRKFADRILQRRESEWETLFEMQHYGVPTRLLDWTETFGIALFFAAHYNQIYHPDKDAAVYLLDPVVLNQISGISGIYRVPKDEGNFPYTRIYWEQSPFKLLLNTSGAKIGDFLGLGRHGWSKGLILLDLDFCSPGNATRIWCGKYAL